MELPEAMRLHEHRTDDVVIVRNDFVDKRRNYRCPRLDVRFRNDCSTLLGYDSIDCVKIVNRVYFVKGAYKLCTKSKHIQGISYLHTELWHFQGNYNLQYDMNKRKYYIDLEEENYETE